MAAYSPCERAKRYDEGASRKDLIDFVDQLYRLIEVWTSGIILTSALLNQSPI